MSDESAGNSGVARSLRLLSMVEGRERNCNRQTSAGQGGCAGRSVLVQNQAIQVRCVGIIVIEDDPITAGSER
jgi:hypothetical protein